MRPYGKDHNNNIIIAETVNKVTIHTGWLKIIVKDRIRGIFKYFLRLLERHVVIDNV